MGILSPYLLHLSIFCKMLISPLLLLAVSATAWSVSRKLDRAEMVETSWTWRQWDLVTSTSSSGRLDWDRERMREHRRADFLSQVMIQNGDELMRPISDVSARTRNDWFSLFCSALIWGISFIGVIFSEKVYLPQEVLEDPFILSKFVCKTFYPPSYMFINKLSPEVKITPALRHWVVTLKSIKPFIFNAKL